VKAGELVDVEDLRAGPAEKTIREVASGQPTRRGRAPFTAEDDRILTEWVLRAERRGASIKGNEIYKQLELKVLFECYMYRKCPRLIYGTRMTGIPFSHGEIGGLKPSLIVHGPTFPTRTRTKTNLLPQVLHRPTSNPAGLYLDLPRLYLREIHRHNPLLREHKKNRYQHVHKFLRQKRERSS